MYYAITLLVLILMGITGRLKQAAYVSKCESGVCRRLTY